MTRTVYINGDFVPEDQAKISVFDRGFLFADAVYEVTAVIDQKLIDFPGHMQRLERSLSELGIHNALSEETLLNIHRRLIEENNLTEGLIYLQISRGAADRDFVFPAADHPTTIVLFTQAKNIVANAAVDQGIRVVTLPDLRWQRCDIKTTQLLYPSLAKNQALALGADDAWLVRDDAIVEGTSNNAFILTENDDGQQTLITRDLSTQILAGITRKAVLQCALKLSTPIVERAFTVSEAKHAQEALITSATAFVMPVTHIDEAPIGTGAPGRFTKSLRETYLSMALDAAI